VSWWSKLVGGGLTAPIDAIGKVIDDVHTSKEEKWAAQVVMEKLRQEPGKLQAAINMLEAQHRSVFVAGWRPFIGWVCGFTLFYMWMGRALFSDILVANGMPPLLTLDVTPTDLIALLAPLLGLGTLRSAEKFTGVSK